MDITLAVLCGLPGAGKSTLAQALLSELTENACAVVSVDSIEIELRSRSEFTPDLWHAARARALAETQAQLTSMNTGLVIVDDNMYYASMIKPYKTLAREVGAKFAHILLEVDLETALQRNGSRTGQQRVPEDVMRRMAEKFEDQGQTWMGHYTGRLGQAYNVQDVLALIDRVASVPPAFVDMTQSAEADREAIRTNVRHSADLCLRALISSEMKKSSNKAADGKRFAQLKPQLLAQLPPELQLSDTEEFVTDMFYRCLS